jgi:hypothetical protein
MCSCVLKKTFTTKSQFFKKPLMKYEDYFIKKKKEDIYSDEELIDLKYNDSKESNKDLEKRNIFNRNSGPEKKSEFFSNYYYSMPNLISKSINLNLKKIQIQEKLKLPKQQYSPFKINKSKNKENKENKEKFKYIKNINKRRVTFCKRRKGLFKKGSELKELTGSEVLIIIVSENFKFFSYHSEGFKDIQKAVGEVLEEEIIQDVFYKKKISED